MEAGGSATFATFATFPMFALFALAPGAGMAGMAGMAGIQGGQARGCIAEPRRSLVTSARSESRAKGWLSAVSARGGGALSFVRCAIAPCDLFLAVPEVFGFRVFPTGRTESSGRGCFERKTENRQRKRKREGELSSSPSCRDALTDFLVTLRDPWLCPPCPLPFPLPPPQLTSSHCFLLFSSFFSLLFCSFIRDRDWISLSLCEVRPTCLGCESSLFRGGRDARFFSVGAVSKEEVKR